MDRRTFVRSVPAATLVGVAGCLGGYSAPEDGPGGSGGGGTTDGGGDGTGDGGNGGGQTATQTATPPPDLPSSVTVAVGDGGTFYAPGEFDVAAGGTVTWEWAGDDHNIIVDAQPDGADWGGTEGGDETLYDTGHTHSYTFEVPGQYEYHCFNHEKFGMVGSFRVWDA